MNFIGEGPDTDPKTGKPCSVIDVIVGAGGPNPKPGWSVVSDPNMPIKSGWIQPANPGIPDPTPNPPPPVAPVKPYPGDAFFTANVGIPLEADYKEAGQTLNAGSATWFARTVWDYVKEGLSIDESVTKHRKEWRQALGLKD